MNTIDIVVQGIPCEFDAEALDDFEVLEAMAALQKEDVMVVPFVAKAIFGEEQLDNIMSQLRDENGRVKSSVMIPFVMEALGEAAKANRSNVKNS